MIILEALREFQDRYTAEHYKRGRIISVDNDRGIELIKHPRISVRLLEINNGNVLG